MMNVRTLFRTLTGLPVLTAARLAGTLNTVSASYLAHKPYQQFATNNSEVANAFKAFNPDLTLRPGYQQVRQPPDKMVNWINGLQDVYRYGHAYTIQTPKAHGSPRIAALSARWPELLLLTVAAQFPGGVQFLKEDRTQLPLSDAAAVLKAGKGILVQLGPGNFVVFGNLSVDVAGDSYVVSMVATTQQEHAFTGKLAWVLRINKESGDFSCEWTGNGQSCMLLDGCNNYGAMLIFDVIFAKSQYALPYLASRDDAAIPQLTTETLAADSAKALSACSQDIRAEHAVIRMFDGVTPLIITSKKLVASMSTQTEAQVLPELPEEINERLNPKDGGPGIPLLNDNDVEIVQEMVEKINSDVKPALPPDLTGSPKPGYDPEHDDLHEQGSDEHGPDEHGPDEHGP